MVDFINFCLENELLFIIWISVIFIILGCFLLTLALKTRNLPEKRDHPEYFISEFLFGILLIMFAGIYPFLFNQYITAPEVKAQIYFHLWDCINVTLVLLAIHSILCKYRKQKQNYHLTFDEFKTNFLNNYKDTLWADIQRKWMHLIPPILCFAAYYVGQALDTTLRSVDWNGNLLTIFIIFSVAICFFLVILVTDLIRFFKFPALSRFAHEWLSNALRPKELYTPTSAGIMVVSQIPFILAPLPVTISVFLITALSDAIASLIGKSASRKNILSKKIGTSPKTYIGLFAGTLITYLSVLLVHYTITFPGVSIITVHLMAIAASISFALIDVFAKKIPDNFLNPVVCGTLIWIIFTFLK